MLSIAITNSGKRLLYSLEQFVYISFYDIRGIKMQHPATWIRLDKITHLINCATGLLVSFRSPFPIETTNTVSSFGQIDIDVTKGNIYLINILMILSLFMNILQKYHSDTKID